MRICLTINGKLEPSTSLSSPLLPLLFPFVGGENVTKSSLVLRNSSFPFFLFLPKVGMAGRRILRALFFSFPLLFFPFFSFWEREENAVRQRTDVSLLFFFFFSFSKWGKLVFGYCPSLFFFSPPPPPFLSFFFFFEESIPQSTWRPSVFPSSFSFLPFSVWNRRLRSHRRQQ